MRKIESPLYAHIMIDENNWRAFDAMTDLILGNDVTIEVMRAILKVRGLEEGEFDKIIKLFSDAIHQKGWCRDKNCKWEHKQKEV